MIGDLTPAQEAEVRHGVPVVESSIAEIMPRPAEGRHVLLSMRVRVDGDRWLLMIKDQGTCSCEHGPRPWSVAFRGNTCGTCGKPPGRHRTGPDCVRVQLLGARWWMKRDTMACRQQALNCWASVDDTCIGGTRMGRCHG